MAPLHDEMCKRFGALTHRALQLGKAPLAPLLTSKEMDLSYAFSPTATSNRGSCPAAFRATYRFASPLSSCATLGF